MSPEFGSFQPEPVPPIILRETDESTLLSPAPPTERGSERWSWKRTLLNVGAAFAGGAVSFWVGEHLWPDLPAIGLRALAIGFGVTVGGFLVPTMIYSRIHYNTWFGKYNLFSG